MEDPGSSSSSVPSRAAARSSSLVVWDSRSSSSIIREITCLTCSCIKGIHTLEFTEDIAQSLRSCPANVFLALSKNKRAKAEASRSRGSSFSRSSFVRRYFGYYNYNIEPFPVYQRDGTADDQTKDTWSTTSDGSADSFASEEGKGFGGDCDTAACGIIDSTGRNSDRHKPQPCGVTQVVTNDRARIAPTDPAQQRQEPPDFSTANRSEDPIAAVKTRTVDWAASAGHRRDIEASVRNSPSKMKTNPGKKPVRVHLLTGDSILLVFDAKATVKDVFDQVCALHSIKEGHFFGLSAFVENEHRFLDPKQRLNKYAPKEWGKELKRRDSDLSVQPSAVFTVQFQVQYFVEHPKLIRDPKSRYYYYLQLKKNVLQSKVPTQEEEVFTLAATSLHLDMGIFDPTKHTGRYFDPNEYVPSWFAKKWSADYLWSHLPTMHAELASSTPFECQADYISRASNIEDVPVHYYKLYKTKKEQEASVILGIYHQGIRVHHIAKDGSHLLDFEFPWAKVGRLFFAARRFDIYPEDLPASRKLTYYTGSQSRSKYLLRLLRETHSLYMSLTPYVQHMRNNDGRQIRREYRESYISGQDLEKARFGEERLVGETEDCGVSPSSNKSKDGRDKLYKSYNSSTSHGSSHTSGIESDSKQRTEEEEDDSAFVNDFDPIEHDGPPGGGVICITQEHLEAPQHKSLSVTDLTEASPSESHENLEDVAEPETSSEKSEQTIRAAPVEKDHSSPLPTPPPPPPVEEEPLKTVDSPPPTPARSPSNNNNSNSNSVEAFVLETNSLPPKTAELLVVKSESPPPPPEVISPSVSSVETETAVKQVESVVAADEIVVAKPHALLEARNSNPEYVTRPKRQGSRTYYDDTDAVLAQTRSQSTDMDYGRSARHQQRDPTASSADKSSHKHRKHRHKRSSRASGSMQRSGSVDSSLHAQQGDRPLFKHERHSRKDHQRHQRHKSLQDTPVTVVAEADKSDAQLAGPHFGTVPTAKKSVDDLCDDSGPLTRSHRERDLPHSISTQRRDADSGTDACRPLEQRKMSDACLKTLAAQHRKLSDSRIQQQQREHHAKPRKHSAAKLNGHHASSAGNTPHKHEVLLRTKHERAREDRRRPVSYHLASGALPPSYGAHHQNNTSCYNDAALTSRPPVFIDGFKEVIV